MKLFKEKGLVFLTLFFFCILPCGLFFAQEISKTDISEVSVAPINDQAYTVRGSKPLPIVRHNGKTLNKGVDYELSYKSNKKPGTGSVTITGAGRFKGSITRTFHIAKTKVPLKKNLVSSDRYGLKCPYPIDVRYITIHNTANDENAMDEIKYMISNDNKISYHYAVDENEIVQGLPEDRIGWHSATYTGNRKSIGIEICYSRSGGERFLQAEDNAAKLAADLLTKYDLDIDRLKTHKYWSGKNCPERTLASDWDRFVNMVKAYMKDGKGQTTELSGPDSSSVKGGTSSYTGGSVTSYLRSIGQDSSFANRKKLAAEHGISNYRGTFTQNMELLNSLRTTK